MNIPGIRVFSILAALACTGRADPSFMQAEIQEVAPKIEAYAQVEPIAVLPIRAAEAGLLRHLAILPGARVRKAQKLADIAGPEAASLLADADAAVRDAQSRLDAAQKTLAIQREEAESHLSVRQAVFQAKAEAVQAQIQLAAAQERLRALHTLLVIESPMDGTVLELNAADGERIAAGETVLALEPAGKLWLKAAYYGADAASVRIGMAGQFQPADGGTAV
ncbi:MAG: efflux RND transporter periplasmic adaptor subunit, partial [Opitutaceae bacterium]